MDLKFGSCYEVYFRYFYNKIFKRCESFVYIGCDGNFNNYKFIIDCNIVCVEVY